LIAEKNLLNKSESEKQNVYIFKQDPCFLFRIYSDFYSSKYIPELDEELYNLFKSDQENYCANGLYFNKLESVFFVYFDYN